MNHGAIIEYEEYGTNRTYEPESEREFGIDDYDAYLDYLINRAGEKANIQITEDRLQRIHLGLLQSDGNETGSGNQTLNPEP